MDKTISRLIDGSSDLARHFGSEDWKYWVFPKDYIERNDVLKTYLEINKNVEVISLLKKRPKELETNIAFYEEPFVKITDEDYIVHDSVRFILYNFCVSLLSKDLRHFSENVKNTTGLRKEEKAIEQNYSYQYQDEYTLNQHFYKGLKHREAVRNLITRSLLIRQFSGGRQYLNLDSIEKLISYANETYDYSKLNIK